MILDGKIVVGLYEHKATRDLEKGRMQTTLLEAVCEFILLLNFLADAVGHGVEDRGGTFGLFLQRRGAQYTVGGAVTWRRGFVNNF